MKTKLQLAAGAVLVAASVSAFVYVNNERNSMSDLFNANVEALARNESGGDVCYQSITSADGQQVKYCPTCCFVPGKPHFWSPSYTCNN